MFRNKAGANSAPISTASLMMARNTSTCPRVFGSFGAAAGRSASWQSSSFTSAFLSMCSSTGPSSRVVTARRRMNAITPPSRPVPRRTADAPCPRRKSFHGFTSPSSNRAASGRLARTSPLWNKVASSAFLALASMSSIRIMFHVAFLRRHTSFRIGAGDLLTRAEEPLEISMHRPHSPPRLTTAD